MATKKQKREALEAKRLREAEETRQSGLRAQRKDQERRVKIAQKKAQEAADELEATLELTKKSKAIQAVKAMAGVS